MMQLLRKSGEKEEVYDLTETPDYLLVTFCETILRHYDMRNPEARNILRDFADAIRTKLDKNLEDAFACTITYSENELREIVKTIDEMLEKLDTPAPD